MRISSLQQPLFAHDTNFPGVWYFSQQVLICLICTQTCICICSHAYVYMYTLQGFFFLSLKPSVPDEGSPGGWPQDISPNWVGEGLRVMHKHSMTAYSKLNGHCSYQKQEHLNAAREQNDQLGRETGGQTAGKPMAKPSQGYGWVHHSWIKYIYLTGFICQWDVYINLRVFKAFLKCGCWQRE